MSQVYIDDVDAALAYSGRWESATEELRAYHQTIHFTNTVNSKATLTFTGIGVTVYGTIRASETPQSSYSLDGGSLTIYNESTTHVLTQNSALFYTSPIVRNGQHTLTMTNLNDANTFFLDYFIILTSGASASTNSPDTTTGTTSRSISSTTGTTSSSVSSSGTRTSSSSSSTSTILVARSSGSSSIFSDVPPTSTPPISPNSTAGRNSSGSHHTAAIIGAVAALVIVTIFIIICLWLRRRRKQQKESESVIIPSSIVSGNTSETTSFPEAVPCMNEARPPLPPSYAMSEPPAYDADTGPAVQVGGSHLLGGTAGLRRSEKKSSMITTQLGSSSVV